LFAVFDRLFCFVMQNHCRFLSFEVRRHLQGTAQFRMSESNNKTLLLLFEFCDNILSTQFDFARFEFFRPTKQAKPAVARRSRRLLAHITEERLMKTQKRRKRRMERPETYLAKLRKKLGVRPLVETKRREVAKALTVAQGDKVLAAALLGIGKTTIYRTLENGRF
jgi:hypothetical protein